MIHQPLSHESGVFDPLQKLSCRYGPTQQSRAHAWNLQLPRVVPDCEGNSEATSLPNGSSCLTGSLSTPMLSQVESIDSYSPIAFFGYCGQLRSADTMFPFLLSDQSFSATKPLFR